MAVTYFNMFFTFGIFQSNKLNYFITTPRHSLNNSTRIVHNSKTQSEELVSYSDCPAVGFYQSQPSRLLIYYLTRMKSKISLFYIKFYSERLTGQIVRRQRSCFRFKVFFYQYIGCPKSRFTETIPMLHGNHT